MKLTFQRLPLLLAIAVLLLAPEPSASALVPARTKEQVQRKAVVVTHGALLYEQSSGESGKETTFMQVYFLLEGEAGGRLPVTREPNQSTPDGWVSKQDIVEWNTLQMINFEPQSGRGLVHIFDRAPCAAEYGLTGEKGNCEELGREPRRSGKKRDNYAILIPVFEKNRDLYRGGFVRVTSEGPVVRPQGDNELGSAETKGKSRLGYDLVLVIDATASMEHWFKPTTEVLNTFVNSVASEIGTGEKKTPFRVGLLFYRDRKLSPPSCDLGFITRWEVELTDQVASVTSALVEAHEAHCDSDEAAEAVFDGLSRAVQDPKWSDGHFKVVLLIGDAPPHNPANQDKNPLGLTVGHITKMSRERNIRFLTFKIGDTDTTEFQQLATSVPESVKGRFSAIEPDVATFKQQLLGALRKEWDLIAKANIANRQGISAADLTGGPAGDKALGIDVDSYDLPIIIANLPPNSTGNVPPEFVEGWVPKRIKKSLAMGEFVFMGRPQVQKLANITDTIAITAQEGMVDGPEAFIKNLSSSLAAMLNVAPDDIFRAGESLEGMLKKAELLPFKTTVLQFTAEEINTWKPGDFKRLNTILSEKSRLLREFAQKPSNLHIFGTKPHIYVPRDLFP